jgi:hypothetical protein
MKNLTNKQINALVKQLESLKFKVFTKPFELNIVGERKDNTTPNSFDDKLFVFWKNDNKSWEGKEYQITTDPGTYWLKAPMNVNGTAILKAGQYIDAYKIGLHKGKPALVQAKPITVIRDYDRNAILDFNNGKEYTGNFFINIHRAGTASTQVGEWSAGCQVFANEKDFLDFLELVNKDKQLNGDAFTYTLIDERASNRAFKRGLTYQGIIILATIGYIAYRKYKKLPVIPKSLKKYF